jgi:phage gpG-like protein
MSITSDRRNVLRIEALERLDAEVLQRAGKVLGNRLLNVIGVAQNEYLQGPRPEKLSVVTRRLLGSLEQAVTVGTDRVTGVVGTNVPYAGFHEFGFHGSIQVREHTRIIGETNDKGESVDTRKAIRDPAGNIIGFKRRSEETAKTTQTVKAHKRQVEYAGRPFLRPALLKVQPLLLEDLRALFQPKAEGAN